MILSIVNYYQVIKSSYSFWFTFMDWDRVCIEGPTLSIIEFFD